MAIREVVRFMCDAPECSDIPAMTEAQAIAHVEQHLRLTSQRTTDELEYIWNMVPREHPQL